MVRVQRNNEWYCIGCDKVLGFVLGSELVLAEDIGGKLVQTRGPNLVIKCPTCESKKVWYTADPVVRAIYQLVEAISSVAAKRMVTAVADEIRNLPKADSLEEPGK